MDGTAEKEMTASEALPQTDTSYRLAAATRSPTNLRSVPVAENLTQVVASLPTRSRAVTGCGRPPDPATRRDRSKVSPSERLMKLRL